MMGEQACKPAACWQVAAYSDSVVRRCHSLIGVHGVRDMGVVEHNVLYPRSAQKTDVPTWTSAVITHHHQTINPVPTVARDMTRLATRHNSELT